MHISFGGPILAVAAIGVIAIMLSAITYQFFNDAANKVVETAAHEAGTAAKVQAHDLANALENRFESTMYTLDVIAHAPDVQDGSIDRAKILLRHSQDVDKEITDYYGWADKDGKIVWSTYVEEDPDNAKFLGADKSGEPWFIEARDTQSGYAGYAVSSVDNEKRLYLSYPIIDSTTGEFEGVAYATMPPQKVNNYVNNLLYSEIDTTLGLLDLNGVIFHATYPELVGLNYFSEEYQRIIQSAPIKTDDPNALKKFITQSLEEGGENSIDLSYSGAMATTAYSPVMIDDQRFMMLYTRVPHVVVGEVADLVDRQRIASWFLIGIIGAAAAGIAFLTLMWNRKLESTVAERTQQLRAKTAELEKSNKELLHTTDELRQAFASLAESNEKLTKANEQLLRHDRMQQEFIDVAAHELRTPIQPLLVTADVMSRAFAGGREKIEVTRAEVELIVRNARRLARLSSDILDVSRIESQSLKLEKEYFDLNETIRNTVEDFQAHYNPNKEKVQMVFHPARPDTLIVNADKSKIVEVLSNLLSNAVKFTEEGKITITCEKGNGRFATVRVSDTGTGIGPEIMPSLFTKFVKGHDKFDSRAGSGLGLFISKGIIEAHGGRIWVENGKVSKGATFTFTLPLEKQ